MAGCRDQLVATVAGSRILAIGAAGSIGSSTVLELARLGPKALHVVDQNENGLAELVRRFRSRPQELSLEELRSLPLDYGSQAFRMFLRSVPSYDLVLNFAALKHVRSEKDPYSALQMLDTNVVKQARLLAWLGETGFRGRFFTVSTDKAANPSSMMGATKRLMEHVLFTSTAARDLACTKTSARFANVAFSNGSLLQSFESRLARGEPLAVPRDTRRYFVSLEESGQICTLAACVAPDRSIVIPKLDPRRHLVPLEQIARRFLEAHGHEPEIHTDEVAACSAVAEARSRGAWPLLLTPLDTAGEKPYEEFATASEQVFEFGMRELAAVRYLPAPQEAVDGAIERAAELLRLDSEPSPLDKDVVKSIIASVEPDFLRTHRESAKSLDERL